MSEFVYIEEEPEIAEFGIPGVIGLAGEAAMAHHHTTAEVLSRDAELAIAVHGTYMSMLDGFAERNSADTWNKQSETALRQDFAAYVTEAGIGES